MNHIKYEWMQGSWTLSKTSPEWNKTKQTLESTITKLLNTEETLTYEAIVKVMRILIGINQEWCHSILKNSPASLADLISGTDR